MTAFACVLGSFTATLLCVYLQSTPIAWTTPSMVRYYCVVIPWHNPYIRRRGVALALLLYHCERHRHNGNRYVGVANTTPILASFLGPTV